MQVNKILDLPEQNFKDLVEETARKMGIQPESISKAGYCLK
jgi:ethanolamine utilization protein EutA (predicted chaperonin)